MPPKEFPKMWLQMLIENGLQAKPYDTLKWVD